jgi:CDP-diglyceride synthetase
MRVLRSRVGWILVVLYVAGFIWAYFDAMAKKGTFLYDIWLDLLALPYIVLVGRLFLQDPNFALHAHEPWGLVPAVVFCGGLLLLLGAGIETAVRRLMRGQP